MKISDHNLVWAPKSMQIENEIAGTWSVKITTQNGASLTVNLIFVKSCVSLQEQDLVPQPYPWWPTKDPIHLEVPLQRHLATATAHQNCSKSQKGTIFATSDTLALSWLESDSVMFNLSSSHSSR